MTSPLEPVTLDDVRAEGRGAPGDRRAIRILAKSIYRELRQSGLDDQGVMSIAGEVLSLLASDVKDRRRCREAVVDVEATPVPGR